MSPQRLRHLNLLEEWSNDLHETWLTQRGFLEKSILGGACPWLPPTTVSGHAVVLSP